MVHFQSALEEHLGHSLHLSPLLSMCSSFLRPFFAFQGHGSVPVVCCIVPWGHPGNSLGGPGGLRAYRAEHLQDTPAFLLLLSCAQPLHVAVLVRSSFFHLLEVGRTTRREG